VPKELGDELRVSLTPSGVESLLKAGFKSVVVESQAGAGAQFTVRFEGQFTQLLLPVHDASLVRSSS
jgi:NAD/NADP transhydrogenase alpha subunit